MLEFPGFAHQKITRLNITMQEPILMDVFDSL